MNCWYNLSKWDEFCHESCPWCTIDRWTCWIQCDTTVVGRPYCMHTKARGTVTYELIPGFCKNFNLTASGREYHGDMSVTKNGFTCKSWAEHCLFLSCLRDEEPPANYCRNPDDDPDGLWCFTNSTRGYDYCDVPDCWIRFQFCNCVIAMYCLWGYVFNLHVGVYIYIYTYIHTHTHIQTHTLSTVFWRDIRSEGDTGFNWCIRIWNHVILWH